MRSKWLDWRPGVETITEPEPPKPTRPEGGSRALASREASIIEEVARHEPSKPTKPGFDGFAASRTDTFSITQARVPQGAILLAPRFDGAGKPLASVPGCWCCKVPYKLERLQKSPRKTYAFLEPGCDCLDASMCYRCFVCRAHCRCGSMTDSGTAPKTAQEVFRTPNRDGGAG